MCGLCGVVSGERDWADGSTLASAQATARAARLYRVRVTNAILAQFGLVLSDWQGAKYLLSSRTGRTEIVDTIAQVWQAAELLRGQACDPLDLAVIASIERIGPMG